MHQRDGRGHGGIAQVRIILFHLLGHQHALVSEGAGREAGDIKPLAAGDRRTVADRLLGHFADDVQLALKRRLILDGGGAADKNLGHVGLRRHGGFAECGIIRGHLAPAEHHLALVLDHAGERLFDRRTLRQILRQKDLADAIETDVRQGESEAHGLGHEEIMGHLDQNTGAIAGVGLAAARAAVVEVNQDLQGVRHHLVGLLALHVHHEPQPARIVLELRIVKALFRRQPHRGGTGHISCRHCFLGTQA